MSTNPEVEARLSQLYGMKTREFTEIVRKDIDGILDKYTRAALEHPTLSQRWLRTLFVEKSKTLRQLRTLKQDGTFKDRAALHRLDMYIHTLEVKYADVEWVDKKNRLENARLHQEAVDKRKQEAPEREAAEEELRMVQQALKKERATLERISRSLQRQSELLKEVQAQGSLPVTFKRQAFNALARRHPEEFKSILTALLTDAKIEFTEENILKALEKIIQ